MVGKYPILDTIAKGITTGLAKCEGLEMLMITARFLAWDNGRRDVSYPELGKLVGGAGFLGAKSAILFDRVWFEKSLRD